jgi:hypothetical protein
MSSRQVSQAEDWGHLPSERASYRLRVLEWVIKAADRTPMHLRPWFQVSEIADACARIPGSVELDQAKRARALELLRKAILAGEFDDASVQRLRTFTRRLRRSCVSHGTARTSLTIFSPKN